MTMYSTFSKAIAQGNIRDPPTKTNTSNINGQYINKTREITLFPTAAICHEIPSVISV